MIILSIFAITLFIALLVIIWQSKDTRCVLTVILGISLISCISIIENLKNKVPTALDVYRDKTTLEITYKQVDSLQIPIDSTVIWKENYI